MNASPATSIAAASTAGALRTALLGLFLLGVLGTTAELILLGHFEDTWQVAPLALSGASVAVVAWYAVARSSASIQTFRGLMVLFLASGVTGTFLHYRANMEFELEMYPGMQGVALFRESITGAFPALAPGSMCLFGLIGLAWTFRHPALPAIRTSPSKES